MEISVGLRKRFGLSIYIAIFLIIELVFGYFILESRNLFVENTIQDGCYLAQAQSEKIQTRMDEYRFAVDMAGKYLDEMVAAQIPDTQIQQWMKSYCDKIADQFGGNVLDLYAVLNGTIVAANPWEGNDGYDYASTSWYSDAVAAAPGTIVFSDLYADVITGRDVFTMSQALSDTGNVVAVDVHITSENWMDFSELPDGYGLQVYDPHQTLAYAIGYTRIIKLRKEILAESPEEVSHYTGYVEEDYNLYLCKLNSGWSVVIAIPGENLISANHMLLMNLGLGLNVLNMVITMGFLISHVRNSKYLRQDSVTGLLNRSYLIKQVRKRLKKSGGTLLIVDLDNFKNVNDNYGHDHGDLVLVQVAEVLQSCFRKTDCIGRLGGDEFVIYMDASLADATLNVKMQELIHQVSALSQQYPLSNLSISIGGCLCKKGDKYSEVLKHADEALYQVKHSGKCGFVMSRYNVE